MLRLWISCFVLVIVFILYACTPPSSAIVDEGISAGVQIFNENGLINTIKNSDTEIRVQATGLSVLVLGSGGPDGADDDRASSGYVIYVEGKPKILMDTGGGSYERLVQAEVNLKDIDIILLTHLHIDHTSDLSAILKLIYFQNRIAGTFRTAPFHIYGPEMNGIPFPDTTIAQYPSVSEYIDQHYHMEVGTERYLNIFAKAINGGDFGYMSHDLSSDVTEPESELINENGLVVKAIAVDHGPVPAVAFRIDYNGRSIVYSGDTTSKTDNMIKLSQEADLVFYDTAITDTLPGDIISKLHTTPTRMGEVVTAANVKTLILTHLTGTTLPRLFEVAQAVTAQGFAGDIQVAEDLEVYHLDTIPMMPPPVPITPSPGLSLSKTPVAE